MAGAFNPTETVSSILLSFVSFGINGIPVVPIGLFVVLIRLRNRYDATFVEALSAEKKLVALCLAAFLASFVVFTLGGGIEFGNRGVTPYFSVLFPGILCR